MDDFRLEMKAGWYENKPIRSTREQLVASLAALATETLRSACDKARCQAETSEDAREATWVLVRVIAKITEINWETEIQQRDQIWQNEREALLSSSINCKRCQVALPFCDTEYIRIGLARGRYCASCVNEIIEEYTRECAVCGKTYLAKEYNQSPIFCPSCNTDGNRYERHRVLSQLRRAQRGGAQATLTLRQWLSTITFFNGLCAYCQKDPFSELDHFVPLDQGGGTTADNCVPACSRCNASKGSWNPNNTCLAIVEVQDVRLDLVRNYLGSMRNRDQQPIITKHRGSDGQLDLLQEADQSD